MYNDSLFGGWQFVEFQKLRHCRHDDQQENYTGFVRSAHNAQSVRAIHARRANEI
jgi:hypothetical protein